MQFDEEKRIIRNLTSSSELGRACSTVLKLRQGMAALILETLRATAAGSLKS